MKKRRTFIVALVSFGISTALMVCGTFTYLENKTYDSRTAICKPSSTASENICFITVDQESIDWAQKEKGWGWPWPRAAYGDMVRYLTAETRTAFCSTLCLPNRQCMVKVTMNPLRTHAATQAEWCRQCSFLEAEKILQFSFRLIRSPAAQGSSQTSPARKTATM